MKVLLTGGTGFIGRHVLSRLLRDGADVRLLALPGTTEGLARHAKLTVLLGSLSDREMLSRAARSTDVVVHLAAKVTGYVPRDFRSVNIEGTRNVLDASVAARVGRFVYMSSTAVYGLAPFPAMWPITEDSPQAAHGSRTLRLYSWSKIEAEKLVQRAAEQRRLEFVIVRPTVVYGPGATGAQRLLAALFRYPKIVGFEVAPNGVLQWMHVDDLVEMMARTLTRKACVNQAFNAAGTVVTLRDVAAALGGVSVQRRPLRGAALNGARPWPPPFSMEKAKRLLKFAPAIPLVDGLRSLFDGSGDGSGLS
jgi:nucleoside-diphosphate-sugar epimerase